MDGSLLSQMIQISRKTFKMNNYQVDNDLKHLFLFLNFEYYEI